MSMRSFESLMLYHLRLLTGRSTLRLKDVQECRNDPIDPRATETLFHLPELGIYCAVLTTALWKKRKPKI